MDKNEIDNIIQKIDNIINKLKYTKKVENDFEFELKLPQSLDCKDQNSKYLISNLYNRILLNKFIIKSKTYVCDIDALENDIHIVKKYKNPIFSFFSSKEKKENYHNTLEKLSEYIKHFEADINMNVEKIHKYADIDDNQKIEYFKNHQDQFFEEFQRFFAIYDSYVIQLDELYSDLLTESKKFFNNFKANQFSLDLNSIFEKYSFLKQNMTQNLNLEQIKHNIKYSYENCIYQTIDDMLESYSISKLNNYLSAKTLRKLNSYNIYNLSDLNKAFLIGDLTYIDGIGDVTNKKISDALELFKQDITKGVIHKIDFDKKSSYDSQLLKYVYKYIYFTLIFNELRALNTDFKIDKIIDTYNNMNFNLLGFNWFLNTDEEKNQFINKLKTVSTNFHDYKSIIEDCYSKFNKINNPIPLDNIWSDFANNAPSYYAALEKILGVKYSKGEYDQFLEQTLLNTIKNTKVYVSESLQLRPYQFFGVQFALSQKRIIIGDEMGLGKTIEAIATMTTLYANGKKKFLIICPASIIENWISELSNFSNLKIYEIKGELAFNRWNNHGGVGIISYNRANRFDFNNSQIDCLIVDEAHYIKNEKSQRRHTIEKFIDNVERVIFLTGTPLENRVSEMVGLISLINPNIVNQLNRISRRYSKIKATSFKRIIAPVYLRRKREDVLAELPQLTETVEYCKMSKEEEHIYNKELQQIVDPFMTHLRMVSWMAQDCNKGKRLKELIETAYDENRKVLIFSEFLR